jgi:alkanesulfonate monooxygenase SsuD/methylene tetrahydromethanopterin reductase-like flavin-dependent oxidoreductase (luciferase family)
MTSHARASLRTEVLRAAEAAGFSGVSVMDHLIRIPQVGRAWDDMLDPYMVLAHAAAVTDRLRLGVLVTNVTLRPVAVPAKMLASLDRLSGGRVDCGLGAGRFAREQVDRGIEFPSDRRRPRPARGHHRSPAGVLGPGGKPWSGSTLRIADTGMYPRPVQDRIPIIVGGGGERRTLRIVAEHADGCNLFTGPHLDCKLAVLAEHCGSLGRDVDDLLVTVLDVTIAADDRDHLADLVERHRGNTSARAFRERTSAGIDDDHVLRYRALRDAGVDRVYVSLIDLSGVDEVERFGRIISAV